MTSNETWGGMIAMNLRYFIFCGPCQRDVELDMTKLPPEGPALNRRFRCSQCGRYGQSIVSPASAMRCVPVYRPLPK